MKSISQRNEKVSKLHQSGDKDTIKMIAEIIQWKIDDIREENDGCELSEVAKNQGAIRELKRLVKSLTGIDMPQAVKG